MAFERHTLSRIPVTGPAGTNGTNGTPGASGTPGTRGSLWTTGTGAPSGGTPAANDLYLNSANGDVYQYSGSVWSVVGNIKGASGSQGIQGLTGNTGPAGVSRGASISVPILLLGAAVDRPIVWTDISGAASPMPSAAYTVLVLPDVSVIGKGTYAIKSGTQSAAGLTITVTAGLAIAVAGVAHVIAYTT